MEPSAKLSGNLIHQGLQALRTDSTGLLSADNLLKSFPHYIRSAVHSPIYSRPIQPCGKVIKADFVDIQLFINRLHVLDVKHLISAIETARPRNSYITGLVTPRLVAPPGSSGWLINPPSYFSSMLEHFSKLSFIFELLPFKLSDGKVRKLKR